MSIDPLLLQVADNVLGTEDHNQDTFCGTSRCLAGHYLSFKFSSVDFNRGDSWVTEEVGRIRDKYNSLWIAAKEEAGLTSVEAKLLFDSKASVAAQRWVLSHLKKGTRFENWKDMINTGDIDRSLFGYAFGLTIAYLQS